jgi:hypothetical protein
MREAWARSIPAPYRPKKPKQVRFPQPSGDIVLPPPEARMAAAFLAQIRRAEARDAVYTRPHVSKAQQPETAEARQKRLASAKKYRDARRAA